MDMAKAMDPIATITTVKQVGQIENPWLFSKAGADCYPISSPRYWLTLQCSGYLPQDQPILFTTYLAIDKKELTMTHSIKFIQKTALALGLATLASMATPTALKAETIRCPLDQIRREVTTPLPAGWWNTPIVNSLTETKIITFSSGKKAMQCRYGPAGSIMLEVRSDKTCTAISGGFNCTTTGGGAPRTFKTGSISLRQTYLADFDRNSSQSSAADIWFQAETSDLLYITPRNGAKLGVGNRSNRGYAGCSAARYSSSRVSLRDIPVGSYICVKTNEGRISQFRMNSISGGSPKTLGLGFTTWR